MKVLFVTKSVDFIDPLGLMLMSALARRQGHKTALAVLDREDVLARAGEMRPDVVAYSASTGEHKYYLTFNEALKKRFPRTVTILGGPHGTFFPEVVRQGSLDAVCVGEGDEAFPEFLGAVANGTSWEGLRNIATSAGPRPELRPLFQDLDSLPHPDRDLYYRTTEMSWFPLKSFMTSRGCPYPCTYCFNHAFRKMYRGLGKAVRRNSVEYVVDQILRVRRRYPLEFVKFYDDIFVYRVDEWMERFSTRYVRDVGLPFHCLTRADLVNEEIVRFLKEAGCRSVSMSIEAGREEVREGLLKRKMANEQIVAAFRLFEKHGIATFSNNIIGLPGTRPADDIATLDLNLRCRVTFAEFPIFYPYPRTELGDSCVEKGLFQEPYEAVHMSYHGRSPLTCFTEREKDVQRNLSELGLVVILFPRLRNLVVNRLLRFPPNRIFFLAYYLAKAYLVYRRVYPFRIGPMRALKLLWKSVRLESFKHQQGGASDLA